MRKSLGICVSERVCVCVKKVSKMSNTVETNVNNILKKLFLKWIHLHSHSHSKDQQLLHAHKKFSSFRSSKKTTSSNSHNCKIYSNQVVKDGGLRVMATNRTRRRRRSKKTLTTQQDNNRTKPNFLPTIWNEKRAVTHSKMA